MQPFLIKGTDDTELRRDEVDLNDLSLVKKTPHTFMIDKNSSNAD